MLRTYLIKFTYDNGAVVKDFESLFYTSEIDHGKIADRFTKRCYSTFADGYDDYITVNQIAESEIHEDDLIVLDGSMRSSL